MFWVFFVSCLAFIPSFLISNLMSVINFGNAQPLLQIFLLHLFSWYSNYMYTTPFQTLPQFLNVLGLLFHFAFQLEMFLLIYLSSSSLGFSSVVSSILRWPSKALFICQCVFITSIWFSWPPLYSHLFFYGVYFSISYNINNLFQIPGLIIPKLVWRVSHF